MDVEVITREWLRLLRGPRSQVALSRRLGYRTNVVYTWESGRRWPRASVFLRCAALVGVDVGAGLAAFFTTPPPWLQGADPTAPETITRLMGELRGGVPIQELARRTGHSRFAISRWLRGEAHPRIHELLALIDASTDRLLDFLAGFVDPALLPSVRDAWREHELSRRLLVLQPWSHAVLIVLSLPSYRSRGAHTPGWIADQLSIGADVEQRCIEQLEAAGVIGLEDGRYVVRSEPTLDTRRTPDAGQVLKAHWTRAALDRIERGADGRFSFNVFAVSRADLERIEALHLEYFRTVRAIVADSEPEVAVGMNVQLFPLSR